MKRLLFALCVLCASPLLAQTVMPPPVFQGLNTNGTVLAAGKLCTYVAGTTSPATTYTSQSLAVANQVPPNAIVLDGSGRANVFLTSGQTYKFVLLTAGTDTTCSTGSTIWTQDGVQATPSSSANVSVLGTAGATVTANQVVYLSDGSGGKTAGQWFPADSTNTYSSTSPVIGVAPNAIASAASGTILLEGYVTNLSSLAIGSDYFVSTSGTLTSSAPANRRYVGRADTATTLVLRAGDSSIALGSGTPSATTFLRGDYQWINVACGGILLKQNSGTSTTTGANDLDTYALSGLTAKDVLVIAVSQSQATQTQAGPVVINQNTDTKLMADLAATGAAGTGNALAAGKFARDYWEFSVDPSATTKVYGMGQSTGNISFDGGQAAAAVFQNAVTWTTAFTGSVTLALHSPGQTNGGTTSWEWWICKRPGQ